MVCALGVFGHAGLALSAPALPCRTTPPFGSRSAVVAHGRLAGIGAWFESACAGGGSLRLAIGPGTSSSDAWGFAIQAPAPNKRTPIVPTIGYAGTSTAEHFLIAATDPSVRRVEVQFTKGPTLFAATRAAPATARARSAGLRNFRFVAVFYSGSRTLTSMTCLGVDGRTIFRVPGTYQ